MIIRPKKRQRFTRISNATLEDARVGPEGRSILVYLLTKKDNWTISLLQITRALNMSMYAVKKGMRQLAAVGYARLVQGIGKNGRYIGKQWEISELPIWEHTNRTESKRLADNSPIARNHRRRQIPTIGNSSDIVTTDKSSNYSSSRVVVTTGAGAGLPVAGPVPDPCANADPDPDDESLDAF
jgi:hypothetical protein